MEHIETIPAKYNISLNDKEIKWIIKGLEKLIYKSDGGIPVDKETIKIQNFISEFKCILDQM